MKKINNPRTVFNWGYHDKRLGKGFVGTRDHIIVQVQTAYVEAGIDFFEQEIPALIDDFMCEQGLASPCSERIEGLGDLVHLAISPIAKAIDYVAGTNLSTCKSCSERRRELNQAVPL